MATQPKASQVFFTIVLFHLATKAALTCLFYKLPLTCIYFVEVQYCSSHYVGLLIGKLEDQWFETGLLLHIVSLYPGV